MCADFDPQRVPTNRHRFIVRHPSRRGAIAVERNGALPRVDTDDRHTADVDHLNTAVEMRYGLRTTVLRSLLHGDVRNGVIERAHELEVHGDPADSPLEWRRMTQDTAVDAADRAAIEAWLEPRAAPSVRPWSRPGWYARACAWIEQTVRNRGAPVAIRQLRNWASSCVLRVDVGATTAYFKAVPPEGPEFAVTRWLANAFPDAVASLVGADARRRWLLLGECAGRNLESLGDIEAWSIAAERYGRLQVDCIERAPELRRVGVPQRALAALPAAVAALAADEELLRAKDAGLDSREIAQLRAAAAKLDARCTELAASAVPNSLEHGDLWPGNIFVGGRSSAVIDWEDAAIAQPFLSLAPLIVGLGNAGIASAANVERVERAYLRAFEAIVAPSALRRALELAAPLCFFDMAVRYRAQRTSVVRLHPWMKELVPQTIRLALARL